LAANESGVASTPLTEAIHSGKAILSCSKLKLHRNVFAIGSHKAKPASPLKKQGASLPQLHALPTTVLLTSPVLAKKGREFLSSLLYVLPGVKQVA
jgi:hypothetical protein